MAARNPRTTWNWLRGSVGAAVLAEVTTARIPLSHDALDAHPQRRAADHLRHVLVEVVGSHADQGRVGQPVRACSDSAIRAAGRKGGWRDNSAWLAENAPPDRDGPLPPGQPCVEANPTQGFGRTVRATG